MSKHTILIVEDEAPLRDALAELFSEEYKVLAVPDGEKGLNAALNAHPKLIILDAMMPIMGGLEMLKRLRRDEEWGSGAQVILLTNVGNIESSDEVNSDPNLTVMIKSNSALDEILSQSRKIIAKVVMQPLE